MIGRGTAIDGKGSKNDWKRNGLVGSEARRMGSETRCLEVAQQLVGSEAIMIASEPIMIGSCTTIDGQ